MKIATFGEDFTVGIVRGDTIIDATSALEDAANLAPDERVIAMIERLGYPQACL